MKIKKDIWKLPPNWCWGSQYKYSTPRGKTDKLEEPVNRELNVTKSWNVIYISSDTSHNIMEDLLVALNFLFWHIKTHIWRENGLDDHVHGPHQAYKVWWWWWLFSYFQWKWKQIYQDLFDCKTMYGLQHINQKRLS